MPKYIGQYKVLDIANILDNIFAYIVPFQGLKKIQSPHPIYLQYKIVLKNIKGQFFKLLYSTIVFPSHHKNLF